MDIAEFHFSILKFRSVWWVCWGYDRVPIFFSFLYCICSCGFFWPRSRESFISHTRGVSGGGFKFIFFQVHCTPKSRSSAFLGKRTLETGAWSFLRTDERRVRRGWPLENSGWTFQVGGPAGRLCARGSRVLSGWYGPAEAGLGPGAATTRMLGAAPSFQVSLGPEAGSGVGGSGSAAG